MEGTTPAYRRLNFAQNETVVATPVWPLEWWRRLEGEKEELARKKEEDKEREMKGRVELRISFVKKFFPEAETTPRGNCEL